MSRALKTLQLRALIYKTIRAFFDGQGYTEVDTPLLSQSTNTDAHIHSVRAVVCTKPFYLQTSPEFTMKRLLALGSGPIYQICHAFRDEENGARHQPEFSMLEWYSPGFDYLLMMAQVEELLTRLVEAPPTFGRLTYFDSFIRFLDLDLNKAGIDDCRNCVLSHIPGIDANQLDKDACLDLLLSEIVAKKLRGFNFLYDYPASQASLATVKSDNPLLAERFELFYNDMELANGFTELTDGKEQRLRFEKDNRRRVEAGQQAYPIDEEFLAALDTGLPDCAGVALGLDRLFMVLMEVDRIEDVLPLGTKADTY